MLLLTQTPRTQQPPTHATTTEDNQFLHIRVLLKEIHSTELVKLLFSCSEGIRIQVVENNKHKDYPSSVAIEVHNGDIFIDGKKLTGNPDISIQALGHCTAIDDRCYQGTIYLVHHNDKILLINKLLIEDYVCAVLRTESWPGWPLEVNKAFAIASRSYVMAYLIKARASNKPYHVKNTNTHQTYQGFHTNQILRQAVDETKGIVLSYNHQPIIAMFDCCCGGLIPADIEDINAADAPYLARTYACTFCKKCKIFAWKKEFDSTTFIKRLQQEIPQLKSITKIAVSRYDKAGITKEITLHDGKAIYKLSGKKLYTLFSEIKSFCFSVTKKKNTIMVDGKGFGHHRGICQWGAKQMVDEGWDYKKILQFYYPGTKFMQIKNRNKGHNDG